MLDTNNLDSLISINITLNVRINALSLSLIYSSLDQSSGQPVNGYDYRAGYRIKIKLIYGLKKRSKSSTDLDIHNTRVPSSGYKDL